MKNIILCCFLFCSQMISYAAPADIINLWNDANRAYQNNQYEHAIDNYEAILNAKYIDAQVYYNLGNAYYKNDEEGKAILNFLRAIKTDPTFKEAQQNIVFINAQNPKIISETNNILFINWYHKLLSLFTPNTWAILAAIFTIATVVLIYMASKRKLKYANRWVALCVLLSIIPFLLSIFSYQKYAYKNQAVVMLNNSFLYDNAQKANVKMSIPEGTIIQINTESKKDLVEVSLANGLKGWMDINDFEKI